MNKSKVALVGCESYDETAVSAAVKKAVDLLGGMGQFARTGEKVLLKVNNLSGTKPEEAVTTHPAVLNAVIQLLLEIGCKPFYGDSPAMEKAAVGLRKTGLAAVAERYGIPQGDFDGGKSTDFPEGAVVKKFSIANACLEADAIISLPKMKTHMLARITGAVKNQFGCVNGLNKAAYHVKISNPTRFCRMLVDLTRLVKPRLYIMDGIVAMEGNGPSGGDPVAMNCILVSADPVALDTVFCRLINLNPLLVPTNKYGKLEGLGTCSWDEIECVGDPVDRFIKPDFKVVRKPVRGGFFKNIAPAFLRNWFYAKPLIAPEKCLKCGVCVDACPVEGKALRFGPAGKKEPPIYNYSKCIRCYCCQEMCPHKAISGK